jgi:antitoxin (DNA-binding transcriptional repressor) of toxin-antitoxin stability system
MTALREVSGELVRVHKSQILAVRVLPQGTRRVEIQLFVHGREAGQDLLEPVARIVPTGPTSFVDPPCVRATSSSTTTCTGSPRPLAGSLDRGVEFDSRHVC